MAFSAALMTDRYELAMLGAYIREKIVNRSSVFELYVRKLPANRNFMIVTGIDRITSYIQNLRFDEGDIRYLTRCDGLRDVMTPAMIEYLRNFRFRGDIYAMREGQIAFGGEPMIRVHGALGECQLLETFMLGVINHETKVASKAARVVLAARGRPVQEFGARRVDPIAAPFAARAAYIAGCASTSCELAGDRFGIPVSGTCAHSYMLSHVDGGEEEAFHQFADAFPSGTTLLVDTFDTLKGAAMAAKAGPNVHAVRLDSGDQCSLSKSIHEILINANRSDIKIISSDDMDEYKIQDMLHQGAPVDGFGVGTAIVLSPDAPSLGAVYKLVEIENEIGEMIPVSKRSPNKVSYGGAKQVLRQYKDGKMVRDLVMPANQTSAHVGAPLLEKLFLFGNYVGRMTNDRDATLAARELAAFEMGLLRPQERDLDRNQYPYPVTMAGEFR